LIAPRVPFLKFCFFNFVLEKKKEGKEAVKTPQCSVAIDLLSAATYLHFE
jgi:hypothetical protein